MSRDSEKIMPLINRKILVASLVVVAIGSVLIISSAHPRIGSLNDTTIRNTSLPQDIYNFTLFIEGKEQTITVPQKDLLFNITIIYDKNKNPTYVNIERKSDLHDFYKQVSPTNESVVFVYPLFTQAAYGDHGFYDYYTKRCGSECLTISIPSKFVPRYGASMTATIVLSLLNYSYITDVDVDKNPNILKKYHKVIILHNEYVTKKEFDAITNHPNVLYLFPNALYAEVRTDYVNNTITLVKGHGYPVSSITNGFNWKFDNSNLEYEINCENMTFEVIPNGKMLNCYPAYRTLFDKSLLKAIKD